MQMRVSVLFTALFLLLCTSTFAQKEQTLFGKSGLGLSGVWGGWTNTVTNFGDDYGYFAGGYGGLEFGRSILVGWGGARLVNDVQLGETNPSNLDMRYNGLMLGYSYASHRAIHPRFMTMIGTGRVDFAEQEQDKIFVLRPSIGIELNVFRWFHLGLDAGYRFVSDTDVNQLRDEDLSAFFGEVKLSFGISWNRHSYSHSSKGRNTRIEKNRDWEWTEQ